MLDRKIRVLKLELRDKGENSLTISLKGNSTPVLILNQRRALYSP